MSSLQNHTGSINGWSEHMNKKISKLTSLKISLQKKYTGLALIAALLGAWWMALSSSISSSETKEDKKAQDSLTDAKFVEFGHFLEQQDLTKIERTTTLWRYLRIARYRDDIKKSAEIYGIPFEYLFALIMVESQGNTWSINERDGWAGFIHFQPDVAKEYGLKLFTDTKKYAQYDFTTLSDQWRSKEKIYKKHGELLQKLMGKSMAELEKLDDRFHTTKCITATAKYLAKIKKNVDKKKNSMCKDASWNTYKHDTEFDFDWMLTLNGFNKWPNRFTVGFADGSHIKNIKNNLSAMRTYEQYVHHMIHLWTSDQNIFDGLQTTKFL